MNQRGQNSNVIELDNSIPVMERRNYVPNGDYLVGAVAWREGNNFGRKSILIIFKVLEGDYFGAHIPKYYNIVKTTSGAYVKARPTSTLSIDFARCFGAPKRFDRIDPNRFQKTPVIATTRTVNVDARRNPLPESLYWSTIDSLKAED